MENQKLLIFDMDGTVIDNEWAHDIAKKSIVAELGDNCTIDYLYFIGRDNRLFWRCVLENMGLEGDVEYLVAQQYKRVAEQVRLHNQPEAPGLTTLLKYAKKRGFKTAVCSGSDEYFVRDILRHMNVEQYYDYVIPGDGVKNLKPAPDIYLKALKTAGFDGENALTVEDSRNGCKAAIAAGIRVVGMMNEGKNPQNLDNANYRVNRMEEIIPILEEIFPE